MEGHIAVKLEDFALIEDFTVCHVGEISEVGTRLQAFLKNAVQIFNRGEVVKKILSLDVFDVWHGGLLDLHIYLNGLLP